MRQILARFGALLDLLSMLLIRDLDARYKGSLLGKLWPLVTQAFTIALYTFVFGIVMRATVKIPGFAQSHLSFAVWLFAGFLPWLAFTTGLSAASNCVVGQPNLVKKVLFPLPLLPIVPVLSSLVESTFGLIPLLAIIAFVTHEIHPTVLLLPFIWILQILFTVGFAYVVSAFTVYLRDVPQTVGIVLNIWFYLTPIVYPPTLLPRRMHAVIYALNPMIAFVDAYRGLILAGHFDEWRELTGTAAFSVLIFTIGLSLYRRLQPAFADVL